MAGSAYPYRRGSADRKVLTGSRPQFGPVNAITLLLSFCQSTEHPVSKGSYLQMGVGPGVGVGVGVDAVYFSEPATPI